MAVDSPRHGKSRDEGVPRWVTVAEAASRARVTGNVIRHWYRSGQLPTQRSAGDHGAFLVPVDMVIALADALDATGEAASEALAVLNEAYWADETEQARAEGAAARLQSTSLGEEVARLRGERDAASEEVRSLQRDLHASERTNAALLARTGHLEDELQAFRQATTASEVGPRAGLGLAGAVADVATPLPYTIGTHVDDVLPAGRKKRRRH